MSELLQQAGATAGAVALLAAILWRLVRPHVSLFVQGVVAQVSTDVGARMDALEASWQAHEHHEASTGRRLTTVEADLSRVVAEQNAELQLYRALLTGAGILPERRRSIETEDHR